MNSNGEISKTSAKAIRLVYFLIISLAITEALKHCVDKIASGGESAVLLLFITFMSFVLRFFLGSYRCLTYDIEIQHERIIVLVDSMGFFANSIIFYIWSLSYYSIEKSLNLIIVLCVLDTFWLVIVRVASKNWERFQIQWISHNIAFTLFSILLFNIQEKQELLLLVVAIIALILDFAINYSFYFPKRYPKVMKVFVAGPYGDGLPTEQIKKNILAAESIGKMIAQKGHIPFIPHKMLEGWERDEMFSVGDFKRIDEHWLKECDALFYIAPSKGADQERELANRMGLKVIERIEELDQIR